MEVLTAENERQTVEEGRLEKIVPFPKVRPAINVGARIELRAVDERGDWTASVFIYPSSINLTIEDLMHNTEYTAVNPFMVRKEFQEVDPETLSEVFRKSLGMTSRMDYRHPIKGVDVIDHSYDMGAADYILGFIKDFSVTKDKAESS